jgi:tRNA threonylcarbamoyladenosine biosynthesis protein TsaE
VEGSFEKIYELGKVSQRKLVAFGEELGRVLTGGETILLYGEIGAGKTTFVRGLASGLEVPEALVRSPTFNIVNTYPGRLDLIHVDLYRIHCEEEIVDLALEDLLDDNTVMAIEWPEKYSKYVTGNSLQIHIEHVSEEERDVVLMVRDREMDLKLSILNLVSNR